MENNNAGNSSKGKVDKQQMAGLSKLKHFSSIK